MTKKFSEYASAGDSVSLSKIDGKPFTIKAIEDSDYNEDGKSTPGVKIVTKETFKIEGEDRSKFHTTRTAIVSKLRKTDPESGQAINQQLHEDLANGEEIGPVVCEKQKSQNGKREYFALVDPS